MQRWRASASASARDVKHRRRREEVNLVRRGRHWLEC